jgi:hypothetical protein
MIERVTRVSSHRFLFFEELFDGVKPQTVGGTVVLHPPKDNKKRLDRAWSPSEDALLKSLVEKYPSNWTLVADSFNSARVTISIDKRTPWECFERWNLKLGGKPSGVPGHADVTSPMGVDGTSPPATPSTSTQQVQMTTRGVKRLANINIAQGQAGGAGVTGVTISSDTIKRRRHSLMYETIRKTAKKREAAQKAANSGFLLVMTCLRTVVEGLAVNQRKPPNIHDTHGQYNKMPKLTPAELSRMKAEKESRDLQEMLMTRRRNEELRGQQLLRAQVVRFLSIWLHCLFADILSSKHQSRRPLLLNSSNHNRNNRNNRNRNNHSNSNSNSNSKPPMVLLDRLPNPPNPLRKSALNLRSLKSTYLSNSECRLQCRRRVCHHSRYFKSRQPKRVRTRSRLLPNRRRKYMPNCKLKCRFKCKHKVPLKPRSIVYPLVHICRHHTIPGLRRPPQALVSHSKLLPLGLLSLLRTLV